MSNILDHDIVITLLGVRLSNMTLVLNMVKGGLST